MAYEPRVASALSGATIKQLAYWRSSERPVLVPEVSSRKRVLYSFRDLVALRTFVFLREQRPLQTIRKALDALAKIGETEHLSKYRLVAQGKRGITLVEGDRGVELVERPGQQVIVIKLGEIMRAFPIDDFEVPNLAKPRKKLSVNPEVRSGRPVVAGTRVDYELVAGLVDDGVPPMEIKGYYPSVTADAARDAASFADHVERAGRRQAA